MRTIVDLGKAGAERLDGFTGPKTEQPATQLDVYLGFIKNFPRQVIEADTSDGVKKSVEVRTLLLSNQHVFQLVHELAVYEPMVYAHQGGKTVFGMLSPNYDGEGKDRLPSIKVIPLQKPYPLTSDLKPDARMATMLTGATNAESKGIGGHSGPVAGDFEHRLTILGAISKDDYSIALNHTNHAIRQDSSVATGLTNGKLGTLYEADKTVSDFTGYGNPLNFHQGKTAPSDAIFLPDSFLSSPEAFGPYYDDASRLMLGAGLQVLYEQRGNGVADQISRLGETLQTELAI